MLPQNDTSEVHKTKTKQTKQDLGSYKRTTLLSDRISILVDRTFLKIRSTIPGKWVGFLHQNFITLTKYIFPAFHAFAHITVLVT